MFGGGAGAFSNPFPQPGASIDIDLAGNQMFGGGGTFASVLSVSNGAGFAQNLDSSWSAFSSNTLRRTNRGALPEYGATSLAASTRDLTTGSWTRSNVTPTRNQAGIEGLANVATLLTATANGAFIKQVISSSDVTVAMIAIRAVTVTGDITLSVDGGTTKFPISRIGAALMNCQRDLDGNFQHVQLVALANNPTIQLTFANSGDSVVVDFFDCQTKSQFASAYMACGTTPIPTAGGTRAQDQITAIGALATFLQGSSGCIEFWLEGMTGATALNCYNGPPNGSSDSPSGGNGSSAVALLWDVANNNSVCSGGSPYSTRCVIGGTATPTAYTISQDFNHPGFANDDGAHGGASRTSPIGESGWHVPSKFVFAWDATGCVYSWNGGTFVTSTRVPSFSASVLLLLNYCGYVQRIICSPTRPSNANVQLRAKVAPLLPALIDDNVAGTNYWTDYNIGQEYPMLTTNAGDSYGIETGQLGAPGGTASGSYAYIRGFSDGKMIRVAILPGDPCGFGIDSDTQKERRELNGGYNSSGGIGGQPLGKVYKLGDTLWVSYSFLVVPGVPIMSHDFCSIGQSHENGGPGQALTLTMNQGVERFTASNDPAAANYGSFILLRGVWNNMVWRMKFSTKAAGEWQLYRNTASLFNQTGIVTVTPDSTFTASASGTVLTVSAVITPGVTITAGSDLYDNNEVFLATITSLGPSTFGGVGTYNLDRTLSKTSQTMLTISGLEFKIGWYQAPTAEAKQLFIANLTQSLSTLFAKVATPDPIPSGYLYSGARVSPL